MCSSDLGIGLQPNTPETPEYCETSLQTEANFSVIAVRVDFLSLGLWRERGNENGKGEEEDGVMRLVLLGRELAMMRYLRKVVFFGPSVWEKEEGVGPILSELPGERIMGIRGCHTSWPCSLCFPTLPDDEMWT